MYNCTKYKAGYKFSSSLGPFLENKEYKCYPHQQKNPFWLYLEFLAVCSDYLVAKPSLSLIALDSADPKKKERKNIRAAKKKKRIMNQNVCNDDVYFNVQFAAFNSTLSHTHTH